LRTPRLAASTALPPYCRIGKGGVNAGMRRGGTARRFSPAAFR
jgi:hypothetical protein